MTGQSRPSPAALRRGSEIRRVLTAAAPLAGRRVAVYAVPSGGGVRAAFVAGRRVGGAVARNRSRRVLREAWRAVAPGARGGFDVVFVAKPGIERAKAQELAEEMQRVLADAGLVARE